MSFIEIYNVKIKLPVLTGDVFIEDWEETDIKEQYWRRKELPSFFDIVEYDKEGNALLTEQQRKYAIEEVRRCKEGFWFYNNGIPVYITGKHYFYLMWWKLEDDIYPEFRDTDRRYFLYLNHWENVPWCLGLIRGKKRREGATSQETSNLIYECIFFKNSFCGFVSKTERDGKIGFSNMISFGYRQLPVFLKPKQLNNKDSVSELVFAHKSVTTKGEKGSVIDNDTGHRSRVDYRAPGKNAYDSGRLSRGLFDEGGKWDKEHPFSQFVTIVKKTLVKGAKKVGFMICPSTVNEMSKSGGAEFKKVWDAANFLEDGRTGNRLVKYFTPAYDGFVGFIDKYGMSVIEEPTEEQYKYLIEKYLGVGDLTESDIRKGAMKYLLDIRKNSEGSDLEEEIRMNPFTEKEMFEAANASCLFNSFKINEQLNWLSWNNDVIERGNLVWDDGQKYMKIVEHQDGRIEHKINRLIWVTNPNGRYEKVKDWFPKEMNSVYERNGYYFPNNSYAIRIGCDPFKYDKNKDSRKSDCAAFAYQLEDLLEPENKHNDMFVMSYIRRAETTDIQYEDVLKMAWFCGCQILFERNVNNWKKYFDTEKCNGFLMWLPGEVEPGIYTDPSGKTTQLICDFSESYIEKDIQKVFFRPLMEDSTGWLGFMVEDTQKYDPVMAAGFALIAAKSRKFYRKEQNFTDINSVLPQNYAA